jgi:hypothetical protein
VPAVLADGKQVPSLSARSIWEWLGMPSGDFRWGWRNARKRQKLVDGKGLVNRDKNVPVSGGRGHKKDYLPTARAAVQVCAGDASARGLALLKQLSDLAERIEAGDLGLAASVRERAAEVHRHAPAGGWAPRAASQQRRTLYDAVAASELKVVKALGATDVHSVERRRRKAARDTPRGPFATNKPPRRSTLRLDEGGSACGAGSCAGQQCRNAGLSQGGARTVLCGWTKAG